MNSFVPSASPTKFATVFGASFSKSRITIFPIEVSKIAYVPAARPIVSPFLQRVLILHDPLHPCHRTTPLPGIFPATLSSPCFSAFSAPLCSQLLCVMFSLPSFLLSVFPFLCVLCVRKTLLRSSSRLCASARGRFPGLPFLVLSGLFLGVLCDSVANSLS